MKKYLVHYSTGGWTGGKSTIVEMPDDYVPADDDMKAIKEKVVEQDKPRYEELYARDGYVRSSTRDSIPADKLRLYAVSDLSI